MYKVRIHGAANAKARSMLGDLLKDEQYKKIISLKTLEEFVDYLHKETHYSKILENKDYEVENIEFLMKTHFVKLLEKLYYFYYDEYRNFIKALLMRYELDNIKIFLRVFTRGESISHGEEHYIYSDLFKNISYKKIVEAENLSEFIESLKGTIYYPELKRYEDAESEKILFYMEMTLDRIYFKNLSESILKLKKSDQKQTYELLGINIDFFNIQWIYRGRKYFNISAEELFNLTLEHGHRYGLKELKKLCYLELDDYKKYILNSPYSVIFEDEDYLMERSYERYLYKLLDKYMKNTGLSIMLPTIYIFKLEYEIRDLSTILECIKYNHENIENMLIRTFERGEEIGN